MTPADDAALGVPVWRHTGGAVVSWSNTDWNEFAPAEPFLALPLSDAAQRTRRERCVDVLVDRYHWKPSAAHVAVTYLFEALGLGAA